jgi:orotate phosphoribosyltransferase
MKEEYSNLKTLLINEGVIKIKNEDEELFTLKSGRKSRFFIDIKEASLNPVLLDIMVNGIMIHESSPWFLIAYDKSSNTIYYHQNYRIGSIAIGGILLGTMLSIKTRIPQIIVRSEKHDRGTKTKIIGECKDKVVVLIDDVATTGRSIVDAVKCIRNEGGICSMCIVVVDRQEGAEWLCKDNGMELISLLKKSDFGIKEEL